MRERSPSVLLLLDQVNKRLLGVEDGTTKEASTEDVTSYREDSLPLPSPPTSSQINTRRSVERSSSITLLLIRASQRLVGIEGISEEATIEEEVASNSEESLGPPEIKVTHAQMDSDTGQERNRRKTTAAATHTTPTIITPEKHAPANVPTETFNRDEVERSDTPDSLNQTQAVARACAEDTNSNQSEGMVASGTQEISTSKSAGTEGTKTVALTGVVQEPASSAQTKEHQATKKRHPPTPFAALKSELKDVALPTAQDGSECIVEASPPARQSEVMVWIMERMCCVTEESTPRRSSRRRGMPKRRARRIRR